MNQNVQKLMLTRFAALYGAPVTDDPEAFLSDVAGCNAYGVPRKRISDAEPTISIISRMLRARSK